ncbi:hypothetical protein, partial [Streptomyces sp. LMG1-1-1.1]|uniref:hypothetical protein n=2 Tax=unclassified Streptomyces TaxID=2593676 RepID=UPI003467A8E5
YPPQGPAGLSKEPRHPKMDGVSTNLALIFGTLLSSQGADASFVPVSRPSGRFLRFRLYQIFPIRFPRCFPVPFVFTPGAFRRFRLYQKI